MLNTYGVPIGMMATIVLEAFDPYGVDKPRDPQPGQIERRRWVRSPTPLGVERF